MVSEFTLTGSSKEFGFPVVGVRSYSLWQPLSSEPSSLLVFSTLLHPTGSSSSKCLGKQIRTAKPSSSSIVLTLDQLPYAKEV